MVGEVAERGAQVGVDLVGAFPGQRPDVDVEVIESGITLVFITPPSMRLGENVVWVQAWRWAAAAGARQVVERVVDRARVEQRRA